MANDRVIVNPNFKNTGEFNASLKARGVGAKDFPNSHTEVEYLGGGKFAASISGGHRVFFDKADNNKPKKHKLTDERATKDYVLVQGAKCCVEVHPYYASYFDVHHEEVRLYEERWVVQRLFKTDPDEWRDVSAWNPQIAVEEYSEPAGDAVKVTVTFDTDYGTLTVEYFQRDDNNLKHSVYFTNTSGSAETFRIAQKWAGIVGNKVEHRTGDNTVITSTITSTEVINSPNFRFLKGDGSLSVFENQAAMFFDDEGNELLDQNLKPVEVDVHAQGMKADFVFGNWILNQDESLEIDPDTATLDDPTEDNWIIWDGGTSYDRSIADDALRMGQNYGYTYISYVEWDISSIDDGATITDTVFKYEGAVSNSAGGHIHEMVGVQPSLEDDDDAGNQAIYDEAREGTVYVDPVGFPVIGENQQVDLGTDADSDLENQLSEDWFAIGLQADDESNGGIGQSSYISGEGYSTPTPSPTLYVEYTLLVAPTVTTQAVDDIAATTATLNGTVTDDGGATIDYYGFVWDDDSDEGDPGDIDPSTPAGTWENGWKSGSGNYGENPFDHGLTGLTGGTKYYVRAAAHNSEGWSYGAAQSFITVAVLVGGVVAVDSSVQTAAISGSGNAPLTGVVVAVTSSIQVASISGSGNAPLTGAIVAVASSVQSAAIAHTQQYLTSSPVAVASSVSQASIVGSGTAPLTATVVGVDSSVVNAQVGFVLQASPVTVTSSVQQAAIAFAKQYLASSPVDVASSVQAASVAGSGNAPLAGTIIDVASSVVNAEVGFILKAAPVAVVGSVVVASISGTGGAPLTASSVGIATSVVQASVVITPQVLLASPVAVSSSVQQSALTAEGNAPLSAATVAVASSVQAAIISGSGAAPLVGAIVSAASSISQAAITHEQQYLASSPVAIASSIQTAALTAVGTAILALAPIQVTSSIVAAVIAGSGIAPLTGSVVAVASSIQGSSIAVVSRVPFVQVLIF